MDAAQYTNKEVPPCLHMLIIQLISNSLANLLECMYAGSDLIQLLLLPVDDHLAEKKREEKERGERERREREKERGERREREVEGREQKERVVSTNTVCSNSNRM